MCCCCCQPYHASCSIPCCWYFCCSQAQRPTTVGSAPRNFLLKQIWVTGTSSKYNFPNSSIKSHRKSVTNQESGSTILKLVFFTCKTFLLCTSSFVPQKLKKRMENISLGLRQYLKAMYKISQPPPPPPPEVELPTSVLNRWQQC